MIQITPVSDLLNKFSEIEGIVVREGHPVYLQKDCYSSMVLLSTEKYTEIADDIELQLDEADREAEITNVRYSHDEVISRVRARNSSRK